MLTVSGEDSCPESGLRGETGKERERAIHGGLVRGSNILITGEVKLIIDDGESMMGNHRSDINRISSAGQLHDGLAVCGPFCDHGGHWSAIGPGAFTLRRLREQSGRSKRIQNLHLNLLGNPKKKQARKQREPNKQIQNRRSKQSMASLTGSCYRGFPANFRLMQAIASDLAELYTASQRLRTHRRILRTSARRNEFKLIPTADTLADHRTAVHVCAP